MKTYLYRAVKIQQLLTSWRTQNFNHNFEMSVKFLTIHNLQAESPIWKVIFLHVIPVRIVVPNLDFPNYHNFSKH